MKYWIILKYISLYVAIMLIYNLSIAVINTTIGDEVPRWFTRCFSGAVTIYIIARMEIELLKLKK